MKHIKFFLLSLTLISLLASCGGDDENSPKVYPTATHLYFAEYDQKFVGVIDLNTPGEYTTIVDATDGLDSVSGMAIDFEEGKIYAVEEVTNKVIRFNMDGSGAIEVLYDEADGVNEPTAIVINEDTDTLYWANSGTGRIIKATMNGLSTPIPMYDSLFVYCYGMAIDKKGQRLYFSDLGNPFIRRGDFTGALTSVVNAFSLNNLYLQNPAGLWLDTDRQRLYWADEGLGKVVVGASNATQILFDREDGITEPDGIAVDLGTQKVYWSETYTDTVTQVKTHVIARGNLDGSGEREVLLQGVRAYSIALKFPAP